jgi:hypothetical protein
MGATAKPAKAAARNPAVLLHNIAVRWAIPACASLVSAASR